MNDRTKRILLIFLFLLATAGIATALYYTFWRPLVPVTQPVVEKPPGTLPSSGTGAPTPVPPVVPVQPVLPPAGAPVAAGGVTQTRALTTGPVADITLAGDGKSINYYDPADGKFYKIDEAGNVVKLSDKSFPNVQDVSWNKNSGKAAMEFPDGSNIIFDFDSETQVTLPKHWEQIQFSPVRDEVIAKSMGLDESNRWLVTTNADNSGTRPIAALGNNADKVQVAWSPNDQVVAFSRTADPISSSIDTMMILPIGKNEENFKGLVIEGLGFLPKWAPDGKQLLYSTFGDYSSGKPLLWFVKADPQSMGENRHSIGLNTWADKCTFSGNTSAYCAVPINLPDNAGYGRTLYSSTPDSLYKVDLMSGQTSLVAVPFDAVTMENLQVNKDQSVLYYTNKTTGRLESVRLK